MKAEIIRALDGLLRIVKTAMPDTYFATDRRVKHAQKVRLELRREIELEIGPLGSRRKPNKRTGGR